MSELHKIHLSGQSQRLLMTHPDWPATQKVLDRLWGSGHESYLAGGCVRDLWRGALPQDFDIATSAKPDEVMKLFPRHRDIGSEFGTVLVLEEGRALEVTMFREDLEYIDGRRPSGVQRASLVGDAQRRDFTINALYLDTREMKVIDHVGGVEDLKLRTVRCVGEPHVRFQEDALRRLRAIRFASQLGFGLDQETFSALSNGVEEILKVSRERIWAELIKLWSGKWVELGLYYFFASGLSSTVWPFFPKGTASFYKSRIWSQVDQLDRVEARLIYVLAICDVLDKARITWTHEPPARFLIPHIKEFQVFSDIMRQDSKEALWNQILAVNRDGGLSQLEVWWRLHGVRGWKKASDLVSELAHRVGTNGRLPPPLLRGDFFLSLGYVPSRALGDMLQKAYRLQVMESIANKDELVQRLNLKRV